MTIVKICGLTRPEDVALAVRAGADWLGFIHVPGSPRFVGEQQLETLLLAAAGTYTVIVVRDADPALLQGLRARLRFDAFQFHGDEPPGHLTAFGGYRVFHLDPEQDQPPQTFGSPFLLDTAVRGQRGGTGQTFDWSILPRVEGRFLVAGGLEPDNVGDLLTAYRPWGVDVSSGVEAAPGVKDPDKLQRFIHQVRRFS